MVSKRLDGMIHGWVERTYPKGIDGYWADLVLSEFAFLEERGGRLEDVRFHQKGDYLRYVGAWGTVLLEFEPDSNWIGGSARLSGESAKFEGELDRLVRERMPETALPPKLPLDRESVAANVRMWAEALRGSPDLFRLPE
jgi:hypothetical protein